MDYRLKGQHHDRVECRGGVSYQVDFQLEPVNQGVVWTLQEELAESGLAARTLGSGFDSERADRLGAVSYVNVEARARNLLARPSTPSPTTTRSSKADRFSNRLKTPRSGLARRAGHKPVWVPKPVAGFHLAGRSRRRL